ncbi:MAG: aspartate kinase [bacterium]
MKVLKFGGTSVGSAQRIREVADIVCNETGQIIVVLSAMSGTTNTLVKIGNELRNNRTISAEAMIGDLESLYFSIIEELYENQEIKSTIVDLVNQTFTYIRSFLFNSFNIFEERNLLAQGELMSSAMFYSYLLELGINTDLVSALEFMRIDKNGEPDEFYIKEKLEMLLKAENKKSITITQGFICKNAYGEIDNLKRGGSDYTATLIGAAVNAEEVQIWTDIDGFHNNDPRIVDNTSPISKMSFDVAAELSYFGAKILHPSSVLPAKKNNIPVRLKNTMEPQAQGTLITLDDEFAGIQAVAAKSNITAIKIKSDRMLMAYGFLRHVFEIFERFKTSIDMITTSEVAVSVTIDDDTYLGDITDELRQFGNVEVDTDQTIICIAGNYAEDSAGIAASVINALKDIPLRMISYGGSLHNISVLINTKYKDAALNSLSDNLFNGAQDAE